MLVSWISRCPPIQRFLLFSLDYATIYFESTLGFHPPHHLLRRRRVTTNIGFPSLTCLAIRT